MRRSRIGRSSLCPAVGGLNLPAAGVGLRGSACAQVRAVAARIADRHINEWWPDRVVHHAQPVREAALRPADRPEGQPEEDPA